MEIILLTVILIMGPGKQDIEQSRGMPSLAECFVAAQAWDEQDIEKAGGIGFASGCSVTAPDSKKAGVEE